MEQGCSRLDCSNRDAYGCDGGSCGRRGMLVKAKVLALDGICSWGQHGTLPGPRHCRDAVYWILDEGSTLRLEECGCGVAQCPISQFEAEGSILAKVPRQARIKTVTWLPGRVWLCKRVTLHITCPFLVVEFFQAAGRILSGPVHPWFSAFFTVAWNNSTGHSTCRLRTTGNFPGIWTALHLNHSAST